MLLRTILSFIVVVIVSLSSLSAAYDVSFDGRSFIIDGQRKLLIAGSVHYPRAPHSEWRDVLTLVRDSGINVIQTYVFWDTHEIADNIFYFPSDPSSSADLVDFVKIAGELGLYVNLRISGYVCAEWNYGGLPVWLRKLNIDANGNNNITTTFRTFDVEWMKQLEDFFFETVSVVNRAGLLAADGGPIIMMQMENEYGNMEEFYGELGHKYVQWAANYALEINSKIGKEIVWIMCQQGEGTGTAPPAQVINTCNGYYCDNWISRHALAFPNQPHMFTENWPGWFQNWGQPVPHRPAVDVAFSVARWFARGGSYMNYYMAYGGTNYGRTVGGPLIITSYDYDVHVSEYAQKNEPKYSLLTELHRILNDNADLLLQNAVPEAKSISSNCESHLYATGSDCIQFLSNWASDADESCSFTIGKDMSVSVPAWSVSIVEGSLDSTNGACVPQSTTNIFNTKTFASTLKSSKLTPTPVDGFVLTDIQVGMESIPSNTYSVISPSAREQLSVTSDSTDYLWYSVTYNSTSSDSATPAVLSFSTGDASGGLVYVYVNKQLQGSTLSAALTQASSAPNKAVSKPMTSAAAAAAGDVVFQTARSVDVSLPAAGGIVSIDLLSVSMGLQNYGPYIERYLAGIVSDITLTVGDGVTKALGPVMHTIGLEGGYKVVQGVTMPRDSTRGNFDFVPLSADSVCSGLCWYQAKFLTPEDITSQQLALDLASMGKGMVYVNGRMLGRYWNIVAKQTALQSCDVTHCSSDTYAGAYSGDICRTGCGEASQRYYKLPADWLSDAGYENELLIFDETGEGAPGGIKLVTMANEFVQG